MQATKRWKILMLQGANMNYLGRREPERYGTTTAAEVDDMMMAYAAERGANLEIFYSNVEGEAINRIYSAVDAGMDGLLKAAAPADPKVAALTALAGSAGGGIGTMASAVNTMSKLGLKPETIAKMTPALIKVVQGKGGAEIGTLLAGALK